MNHGNTLKFTQIQNVTMNINYNYIYNDISTVKAVCDVNIKPQYINYIDNQPGLVYGYIDLACM